MKKLWLFICLIAALSITGNVYAQLATLDVSIGGTGTPATQNLTSFQFVNVILKNINSDTAAGWNTGTNIYTVPTTGLYTIISTLRLLDDTQTTSFAEGVNTTLGDGTWMVWNQFTGKRTTLVNVRSALLTAGSQLQMEAYCDSFTACNIDSAHLTIQQQCTLSLCSGGGGGGFGGFTSTPNVGGLLVTTVANGTTAPAQTIALANANANQVWAGPVSGVAAIPTYRSLVANDIPSLAASKLNSGTIAAGLMPAFTGDVTSTIGTIATTVVGINGLAVPVSQACLGSNSLGQLITGTCSGGSGGNSFPTSPTTGVLFYLSQTTSRAATSTDIQTIFAADTVDSTSIGYRTGSGGDSTLPSPLNGVDYLGMHGGILSKTHGTQAFAPLLTLTCQPGIGDGLNPILAGTYKQTTCKNESGFIWTLQSIKCYLDVGASTCNVTNGAGTALLTGAITGSTSYAVGTQSATVTIVPGDELKFTFIADGTTTQMSADVSGIY